MSSKIEQIIDDIEEYIEGCKPQRFNGSNIIVDRETIEELLTELRMKIPDEIRRYQKMLRNKEDIIADAREKAEEIIMEAQHQNTAMVSEHKVMQDAHNRAEELVAIATAESQQIIDDANAYDNAIRTGSISYSDSMLKKLEDIIVSSIETSRARTESLVSALQEQLNVIAANRSELVQDLSGEQQPENAEFSMTDTAYPTSEEDVDE